MNKSLTLFGSLFLNILHFVWSSWLSVDKLIDCCFDVCCSHGKLNWLMFFVFWCAKGWKPKELLEHFLGIILLVILCGLLRSNARGRLLFLRRREIFGCLCYFCFSLFFLLFAVRSLPPSIFVFPFIFSFVLMIIILFSLLFIFVSGSLSFFILLHLNIKQYNPTFKSK